MTGLREGSTFRSYLGCKTFTSLGPVLGKVDDFIRGELIDRSVSPGGGRRRNKGRIRDMTMVEKKKNQESNMVKRGKDREKGESKEKKSMHIPSS